MRRRMLFNILWHLRSNINARLESLEDARRFVKLMDGLTNDERSFLEIACLDTQSMEALYASLSESPGLAVEAENPRQ